jgi:hypothetical protein
LLAAHGLQGFTKLNSDWVISWLERGIKNKLKIALFLLGKSWHIIGNVYILWLLHRWFQFFVNLNA